MDKPREYPGSENEYREKVEDVEYNDIDQELANDTWSKLINGLKEVKAYQPAFVDSSNGSLYVALYREVDKVMDHPCFEITCEHPDGKNAHFDLINKEDNFKSVVQLLVEEGQVPLSKKEIETHFNNILSGKVQDLSK